MAFSKERVDALDRFLPHLLKDFTFHKDVGGLKTSCPRCEGDEFRWVPEYDWWICRNCEESGGAVSLVSFLKQIPFRDALYWLEDQIERGKVEEAPPAPTHRSPAA
jgi:hypothetical protein